MKPRIAVATRGARTLAACLAFGIGAVCAPAQAQDKWPSRPITWVVLFAAGGTTDIVARTIGQEVSRARPDVVAKNH
ncbi:MAG: hypothetical protein ACREYA_36975 [Cupriavidus necator]